LEFSVAVEGSVIDPESPDLLSRVAVYYLVVNVHNESNQPVAGVEFSLGFTGPDPSLLGLAIEGLGATHQSTLDGVRLRLRADPGLASSFTLTLTGRLLNGISLTYRLGWIYKYSTATLRKDGKLDLRWVCVQSDLDPYSGDVIDNLGTVSFSIPTVSFDASLALRLDGRPLYLDTPSAEIGGIVDNTMTTVTRLVALDGYLVALAGTVGIGIL
jgi:hypothetical protein